MTRGKPVSKSPFLFVYRSLFVLARRRSAVLQPFDERNRCSRSLEEEKVYTLEELSLAQKEHRQQKVAHQLENAVDHIRSMLQRVMQSITKQEEALRKEIYEIEADPSHGAMLGKSTVKVKLQVPPPARNAHPLLHLAPRPPSFRCRPSRKRPSLRYTCVSYVT